MVPGGMLRSKTDIIIHRTCNTKHNHMQYEKKKKTENDNTFIESKNKSTDRFEFIVAKGGSIVSQLKNDK